MFIQDVEQIPDLRFEVSLLVVQAPHIAARLRFDVTTKRRVMGLDVNGRRTVSPRTSSIALPTRRLPRCGQWSPSTPSRRKCHPPH